MKGGESMAVRVVLEASSEIAGRNHWVSNAQLEGGKRKQKKQKLESSYGKKERKTQQDKVQGKFTHGGEAIFTGAKAKRNNGKG